MIGPLSARRAAVFYGEDFRETAVDVDLRASAGLIRISMSFSMVERRVLRAFSLPAPFLFTISLRQSVMLR